MSDVRKALFVEVMQIIRKNDDTTLNQRVHEIIDVVQAARALGDAESTPEQMFDHYMRTAIANAPEPVQKLGEYLTSTLDEDNWPEAERLLNQICAQSDGVPEPDMFWDADDAEQFGGECADEFVESNFDLGPDESMTVRVQLAKRLPDKWMKISKEGGCAPTWEWVKPPQEGSIDE